MAEELSNVAAIRRYFGNVDLLELKKVSKEDREELGQLCREELKKEKQS